MRLQMKSLKIYTPMILHGPGLLRDAKPTTHHFIMVVNMSDVQVILMPRLAIILLINKYV